MASRQKWCWKLGCTTCGCLHFRYSFLELINGKNPGMIGWRISRRRARFPDDLGPFPRRFDAEQATALIEIVKHADLYTIAETCEFPDWLGYLGLIVFFFDFAEEFKGLSIEWAMQLKAIVEKNGQDYHALDHVINGERILTLHELGHIETALWHHRSES